MIYAQFWHKGTSGKLIPACGSDSVLIIDGRYGAPRQHAAAKARLAEPFFARKYDAYTLHAGAMFSGARCLMSRPFTANGTPIALDDISDTYQSNGRLVNV